MLCLLRYVLLCWKCWVDGLHVHCASTPMKIVQRTKTTTPETLQNVHKTNQNKACNFHYECFDEHLYFFFFIKKTIQQGPNKRKTCVPNIYTKTNFNSEISSVNITRKKRRQNHCSSHFILNNIHKIMDIYSVIIFFPSKRKKIQLKKTPNKRPISMAKKAAAVWPVQ